MLGLGLGLTIPRIFGGGASGDTSIGALATANGAWYDPSDLTSMYVGRDGSGGNPADTDLVGVMLDKFFGGNNTAGLSAADYLAANPPAGGDPLNAPGHHAVAPNDASRPTLQQDGSSNYYLDFDGVTDGYDIGDFSGLSDVTTVAAFKKAANDAQNIFLSGNGVTSTATPYVFVSDNGSVSDCNSPGATTFVNQEQLSAETRDVLHDEIIGVTKVLTAIGHDWASGAGEDQMAISGFSASGGWRAEIDLYGCIIRDSTSSGDRGTIETFLAGKSGVTL